MNEQLEWDLNVKTAKWLINFVIITIIIILVALFLSGCSPYFGKQSQYNKGDWYLFASSREVARMERNKQALGQKKVLDQLAVEKLKSQSVDVQRASDGTPLGYKGIVANVSRRKINTIIYGLERKSFFLQPGQEQETALLPGSYTACSYIGSRNEGCSNFVVNSQINYFNGRSVHWYTVYNPR